MTGLGRGVGEQADTAVALVKAHVPRIELLKKTGKENIQRTFILLYMCKIICIYVIN